MSLLKVLGENSNLRWAAQELGISQPAASILLQEIEDALQAQLFERSRHGLVPTAQSAAVIEWAQLTMRNIERAQHEVRAIGVGAIEPFSVGVSLSAALELLPDAIDLTRRSHPSLEILVRNGLAPDLYEKLFRGDIDLLLGPVPWPRPRGDLSYEVLFQERLYVVASKSHPLARHFDPARIDECSWIVPATEGVTHDLLNRKLVTIGCSTPRIALETASPTVIFPMLQSENYLAILPDAIIRRHLLRETITVLPLALPATSIPIGIATRTGAFSPPAVRTFIDRVRDLSAQVDRTPLFD